MSRVVLGCALFVVAGAWMLTLPDPVARIGGALNLAFFGFGVVVLTRQLVRPQVRLRVDERGVTFWTGAGGTEQISWENIAGWRRVMVSGQPMIALDLRDPDAYLAPLPRWKQALGRANQRLVGTPVAIAPAPYGTTLRAVESAMETWRR